MSLRDFFSFKKTSAPKKEASMPIKVATICIMLVTVGVIAKSAYEMKGAVTDIQKTLAHTAEMPNEADGAFYFIEPRSTAVL